jgi:hypothetical protein
MSPTTEVLIGSFFGGITLRILAVLLFDALLSRRLGGR